MAIDNDQGIIKTLCCLLKFLRHFNLFLLMDCSYVIAFSRQNDWTSKRHYKALDVTINQCIIPSVSIFKQFDCKVILF